MVSMVVGCGARCLVQVSPVGLTPLWDRPRNYGNVPGLIASLPNGGIPAKIHFL